MKPASMANKNSYRVFLVTVFVSKSLMTLMTNDLNDHDSCSAYRRSKYVSKMRLVAKPNETSRKAKRD